MKLFLQVLLIAISTPILGIILKRLLIDGVFQGFFSQSFIWISHYLFHLNYNESVFIYSEIFRTNETQWLFAGFFLLLLFIFYFVLVRMTKYFNEVFNGMNLLVEESDKEIILSPELDFMSTKMNQIKNTLKKREKDVLEAEQRKNDLVVYLAHDIKTPLTSVIGYLSLLEEAQDMPLEQKAKYIGITLEKAYRLEQLINEFFEITRFNLQTIVLNKEKINLNFMLQQIADEFYPIASPQGKKVVVETKDELTLWGDADKLARVFNNILKNAIVYSSENSIIKITALQFEKEIIIHFTNQGNPIPSHQLDSIFEKFYRLDTSRSTHTGGAGLGLAIAKEIVTAHGGTISANSNTDQTVFEVSIPSVVK